jgi:hypothetical protein
MAEACLHKPSHYASKNCRLDQTGRKSITGIAWNKPKQKEMNHEKSLKL